MDGVKEQTRGRCSFAIGKIQGMRRKTGKREMQVRVGLDVGCYSSMVSDSSISSWDSPVHSFQGTVEQSR